MSLSIISGDFDLKNLKHADFITIIHGGAGPADPKTEHLNDTAADIAKILHKIDAKETKLNYPEPTLKTQAEYATLQAVGYLENNPRFNAGYGAALQYDGKARVSASFMESNRTKFSSISNVSNVQNPSELAYYLQSEQFCMLDQVGGNNLAKQLKLPKANLVTNYRRRRWQQAQNKPPKLGHGTVGAVTIDDMLNLAACTSTGGVGNETVGRLGDTPTVAGNYCNERAGISCTGIGEYIVNEAFAAKTVVRTMDGLSLKDSMQKGLEEASDKKRTFAAIGLEYNPKEKQIYWVAATNNNYFIWGIKTPQKNIIFSDYL
jgi:L-asparaginase